MNSETGLDITPYIVIDAINDLIEKCHQTAVDKGWWPTKDKFPGYEVTERSFAEQIALMHSELSEALEDYRNGLALDEVHYENSSGDKYIKETDMENKKPCGIASEFADVLIRIFDTCGRYNIPLAQVLIEKMEYNKTRPMRHGGKKC